MSDSDSPFELLWKGYGEVFREFDELRLARWMAQTLSQFEGKVWRLSHPLMGAYRLAAQVAHERQTWFKRLASPPQAYPESPCCRAPMLPLLTREIQESGLLCQHCNATLAPFEDLPEPLRADLQVWASEYNVVHAVAHWNDRQRKAVGNYESALESAAEKAENLLARAGKQLAPQFLELYPSIVWEDQDECLEVASEDIRL